ncbi:hypothetical protein [Actinoplanes sp. NPDC049316]|uniref:hypothetical protein n=1 Tax=Actinoplanes sp. NPDC049316 TaxID=3154727 RepID=UPI003448B914
MLLSALLAVAAAGTGSPAAAAVPARLPIAAVLVRGERTAVVVDLSAGTRSGHRSVTVTRDGVPQWAHLAPVMSDGLAVALVLDTSVTGAATLPAWRSAGARFILEAPAATRAVVIDSSAPAAVIAGPAGGPAGTVRALSSVPARGVRDTAAAMTLALRQFPAAAPGRRLVVLYTTGLDAGGQDAGALAAGFRQSGTILVVVGPAVAGSYWAAVAAATGGFFAPARESDVGPALDQVSTVLASRYLVEFPTPPTLPAQVSVRVDTADLTLTGDTVVAAAPAPSATTTHSRTRTAVIGGAAAAGLTALTAAAVMVVLRRRRRRAFASSVARQAPTVARGRATVQPPAVGRARAEDN